MKDRTPQFLEQLKNHQLELVQDGLKIKAFYLRDPAQGRMMSTLIIFSPEGIALMGDLTPERNGSVSAYGYGIEWFANNNSADYLCSKFLRQRWVADYAAECLREEYFCLDLDDAEQKITHLNLLGLANRLGSGEYNEQSFHDALNEIDPHLTDDEIPGRTYDPVEQGWLCAIQQKFAELHIVREEAGIA